MQVMDMSSELTKAQSSAFSTITGYAKARELQARQALEEVLYMSNIAGDRFEAACNQIFQHARVALHFHPDRLLDGSQTVAEALLQQGIYKSQFETRISNGGLTAFPGGARDLWEKQMFADAYHRPDVTARERPKYGALDLMRYGDGPAPRFGSCYFVLKPVVSKRCTYTYLDSSQDPEEKGTYEQFHLVLAALFKDAFFRNEALGKKDLTPKRLIEHIVTHLPASRSQLDNTIRSRNLDCYIEAQVHGDISLQDDVEALVVDPSFKQTHIEDLLQQICAAYEIELDWHIGFSISAEQVPSDFRGPAMPALAARIACNGNIDARCIGEAAVSLSRYPERWKELGSNERLMQQLKYMWHILVRFG